MPERTRRMFVAVTVPPDVEAWLVGVREAARPLVAPGRVLWAHERDLHVTLKFLGEVPEERVAEVVEAVARVAAVAPRFALACAGVGAFPDVAAPRVLWAGLSGDMAALEQLQKAVEAALAPLGFPPEGRPYAPHVTIARAAPRRVLAMADAERYRMLGADASPAFDVTSIAVMARVLAGAGGARYEELARLPLSTSP